MNIKIELAAAYIIFCIGMVLFFFLNLFLGGYTCDNKWSCGYKWNESKNLIWNESKNLTFLEGNKIK